MSVLATLDRGLTWLGDRFDIRTLLLVLLALHLFAMDNPDNSFIFDEAHYVPAARDLIQLRPSNLEHPFMGKLWAALGILIFGDHWFGWRIFYVTLGLAALYIFYHLARRLMGERDALYATALLGFDTMYFVHASIVVLEIPSLTFAFLAYYLYFKGRYKLSAIAMGISILNKETGVFFLLGLLLYHLVATIRPLKPRHILRVLSRGLVYGLIAFIALAIPLSIYDQVYQPEGVVTTKVVKEVVHLKDERGVVTSVSTKTRTDYETIRITNALDHIIYTFFYATSLTIKDVCVDTGLPNTEVRIEDPLGNPMLNVTTDAAGRFCVNQPWTPLNRGPYMASGTYRWVYGNTSGRFVVPSTITEGNFAWVWVMPGRPPYAPAPYYVANVNKTVYTTINGTVTSTSRILTPVAWYGVGFYPLWWTIWLLVPIMLESVLRRKASAVDLFTLTWIAGNYLPFLYLSGVVQRIVYPFYFLNVLPALCVGVPYLARVAIRRQSLRHLVLMALLAAEIGFFAYFFPVKVFEQ